MANVNRHTTGYVLHTTAPRLIYKTPFDVWGAGYFAFIRKSSHPHCFTEGFTLTIVVTAIVQTISEV